MRKTIREIVEETVAFYTEDPSRVARDPEKSVCYYRMEPGGEGGETRRCAVGRVMTEEALSSHGDFLGTVTDLVCDHHFYNQVGGADETPEDIQEFLVAHGFWDPEEDGVVSIFGLDGDEKEEVIIKTKREYLLDSMIREEYRGHTISFWAALQDLHDNYLGKSSVSLEKTRERAEDIIQSYSV